MSNLGENGHQALKNFLIQFPNASPIAVATGETTKTHMLYVSDREVIVQATDTGFTARHPDDQGFSALLVHADYSSNGEIAVTGREDHGHQLFEVQAGNELNYFRQQAYNPATGLFSQVLD